MTENKQARILVVDDEKYICGIIVEALTSENYRIDGISGPKQALKYIQENPVDLVLTDLVMGEYSGVQDGWPTACGGFMKRVVFTHPTPRGGPPMPCRTWFDSAHHDV